MPVFAHAASAPATTSPAQETTDLNSPSLAGKSLASKKAEVQTALDDIFSRLTGLSSQTQLAINQLNVSGVDTSAAQTDLITANASLNKAKLDIAAFSALTISPKLSNSANLDILKTSANTAEASLDDTKSHLIDTLNDLKAVVPDITTDSQ